MKKIGILMLALILTTGLLLPAAAEESAGIGIVETQYGLAQGVPSDGDPNVTLFKGIPYAAPPVGDLRWKEPQDPAPWDDVRVFDTYAPAAMQFPNGMEAEPWATDFYYGDLPAFSEDCLYLNVATSAVTGDEGMPVFVWFHGGGLRHGYSYEVEFDNDVMAQKGVIVVTVGQRLGSFGNLSLPQLTAESGYGGSGNYGLMDEIKALEWVRDNIAAFGGDPGNVTVGGQSGGTTKTGALFASPLAEGLMNKVIWQSGLRKTTFLTQEDAESRGVDFLQLLGLTGEETLEALRAMDADAFLGTDYDLYQNNVQNAYNIDGKYILVDSLMDLITGGSMKGVSILHGANLGEASYQESANREEFFANYREMLGDLYDAHDFEALIEEYVDLTDDNTNDVARALSSYGLTTQDSRSLPLGMLLGSKLDREGTGGPVYTYLFSRFAPGRNVENDWAWHSSEMWYTFASLRDIPEQRDWEPVDHALADTMSSYWTNFIKTGDPNGEGLPEWKPSTAETLSYINLGDEVTNDTEINAFDELILDFASRQFGIDR